MLLRGAVQWSCHCLTTRLTMLKSVFNYPVCHLRVDKETGGVGVNDRVRRGMGQHSDTSASRLMIDLRFRSGCLAPTGHYFDVSASPHPCLLKSVPADLV